MPSKTLSDFKDRLLKPSPKRSEKSPATKHTLPAAFAFFLISIFIPLERAFWQGIIARRRELYPHVNFDHLCFADVLRICIQTIFLAFFTALPVRDFWQFNPLARFIRAVIRLVGRIGDAIGRLGGRIIFNIGANLVKSRRRVGRKQVSKFQNSIFWAAGIVAGLLAILCITQPFNVQGQVVFLSIVLLSAWSLTHIKARISLMLLFVLSVTVSGRYLWWRYTSTIHADGAISLFLSCLLLAAETYAFIVMVLGYFQVCWPLDRRPKRLPADRSTWPTVDIFIPTYNESLEVIKPTVFAAKNLDWPEDKINVYILDDGSRDWVEDFAKAAGVHYIKRDEHNHAKAGNINNAMKLTSGEFITIYDCDHVPSSDFLTSTVGWLVHDKKIALVQTPHHFYSPDPFEKNLHLDRAMPFENSLFHDYIQKGNDTWNAVMFCGSNAVMRRSALEEIGGIAVETVTEDAHTSLKLNRRGWKSACISKPLASGLSTESLSAHIGQRYFAVSVRHPVAQDDGRNSVFVQPAGYVDPLALVANTTVTAPGQDDDALSVRLVRRRTEQEIIRDGNAETDAVAIGRDRRVESVVAVELPVRIQRLRRLSGCFGAAQNDQRQKSKYSFHGKTIYKIYGRRTRPTPSVRFSISKGKKNKLNL